jgi:amino acid transporter
MADKGQLPKILGHRSVYGTPTYGILMSATGVLCLAWLSFSEIIQMLNILYCFAQVIEFVAFIQLRIRYGHVYRPYRIPLGTLGCVCMLILPTTFAIVMICISSLQTLIVAIVFILLGHVLYYILEYAKKYELCEFDVTSEEVDNSYRLVELCQQEQIQAQVSPCFSNDNSPLMRNLRI